MKARLLTAVMTIAVVAIPVVQTTDAFAAPAIPACSPGQLSRVLGPTVHYPDGRGGIVLSRTNLVFTNHAGACHIPMGVSLRFDFVPITQQFHVANLSIPAPEYPNEFRKVIPHNGSATLVISVEKIMDSQLKRCEPKTARGVIIDDYASKTGPIPVNGTAVVSAYYSRTVPGVCSNVKATAPIVNFGLNWR